MINLLPPETKQSYRYARKNRKLLFWIFAFIFAVAGVVILTVVGQMVMGHSINQNQTAINQLDASLSSQDLEGTKKQATAISNDLKLMVTVLSKEILFSSLLVQLGNITPSGVILTSLSISQTGGAIDISGRAKDYNGAARLQANLNDQHNKIFSKADIVSISCADTSTDAIASTYPCTVTLKALFSSDNPFLFINTQKAGQ